MKSQTAAPTRVLSQLPPYVFSELDRLKAAARARGIELIDLGIGSPDIPVAAEIIEALVSAARTPTSHGYPTFRGAPEFLEAIARFMQSRFNVSVNPQTETLALSGAKEGLAQLVTALCGAGDVVLVPEIYYPVYARSAWLAGAEVKWVPMRAESGFLLDLEEISKEDLKRAKVLIINYPNNPTGARADVEFLQRAVDLARENDILLISDLAYSELTFDGVPAPSALQCRDARESVIEFHTFSKTFSMAGFRLGFAVGASRAIDALAAYRTNVGYGSPTAVQLAGAYALDQRATLVPAKVAEYRRRRDAVIAAFAESGWIIPAPSASMYVWIPIPDGMDDWEWVNALLDAGVVVTPGVAFGEGGKGFFRISLVRDAETLARAARTIAAVACPTS